MNETAGYSGPAYAFTAGALAIAEPASKRPTSLDELAKHGSRKQVRPTMAGAHLAKVTDPQHMALFIAATFGRVARGGKDGQAPVKVLTALARKGYLKLVAHPGARKTNWSHGYLTDAGRRELARLDAMHAAEIRTEAIRRSQPVAV